ncbi:oligosaccharyl transferase STT3 subunit, partial [Archaeoglobales archaeon]
KLNFDYYLNYPYGLKIGWLPLFDYIIAFPGIIFGFKASEIFAAILPPILGLLSILLTYLIAHEIFKNVKIALLSSFLMAFLPSNVNITSLGFADHHPWNILLFLAAIYFLIISLDNRYYYLIISGVLLTVLAFSWFGAAIYCSIFALLAYYKIVIKRENKLLFYTTIALLMPVSVYFVNSFIATAFVILSAFIGLSFFVNKISDRRVAYLYLVGSIATVIILYNLPIEQISFIKSGIDYLFGLKIHLSTIAEAQSFEVSSIVYSNAVFPFIISLPVVFLFLFDKDKGLISIWFILALLLSLLQLRFITLLSAAVAISSAYGICYILQSAGYEILEVEEREETRKKKLKAKKGKKTKKDLKREPKKTDYIYASIFILFLISPAFILSIKTFDMSKDWEDALLWIKNNTPETSYYLSPNKKPEYSILSWWDYGNWIVYVAKRPVVCNNFQAGAIDAAKFFTAQNESDALKIVKKRGIKYIVVDDVMIYNNTTKTKFPAILKIAGYNPDFMDKEEIMDLYNKSMLCKLYNGSKHFKLTKEFGSVKVFEVLMS